MVNVGDQAKPQRVAAVVEDDKPILARPRPKTTSNRLDETDLALVGRASTMHDTIGRSMPVAKVVTLQMTWMSPARNRWKMRSARAFL